MSARTHTDILGVSAAICVLREDIDRAASVNVPVLIEGETGTGKELVALAIHEKSARAGGPFEVANVGALPESLGSGELLGHAPGAFTGAGRGSAGLFERADGGTVFLDEVGTAEPSLQVALLRLAETGRFYRLGGSRGVETDVRLITATNRPLRNWWRRGPSGRTCSTGWTCITFRCRRYASAGPISA